jgi:lipoprotein-releasing system ATP-binding protein
LALIEAKGLKKTYYATSTPVEVLKSVDLSVEAGEILAVVGASGVGKTTLLYMLGALERPTEGVVLHDGIDVFATSTDKELAEFRNRKVGFVFQFHYLIPELTALENAMMPALVARIKKTKAESMAKEAMAMLGVDHRADHKPGELSGGEQQRVAMARSLVMRPPVVLADEPTGNLDTDTADRLHDELVRLNQENQVTFVIVTHNEKLAQRSQRVIRLDHGSAVPEKG